MVLPASWDYSRCEHSVALLVWLRAPSITKKKKKKNPVEHTTRVHNRRVLQHSNQVSVLGRESPEQKSAEMSRGRTSAGRIASLMTRRINNPLLLKYGGQIKWKSLSQHTPSLESASFTFRWDQNRVLTSADRGRSGAATAISGFNLSSFFFQSSPSDIEILWNSGNGTNLNWRDMHILKKIIT